jgi:hypothetical protein
VALELAALFKWSVRSNSNRCIRNRSGSASTLTKILDYKGVEHVVGADAFKAFSIGIGDEQREACFPQSKQGNPASIGRKTRQAGKGQTGSRV